MSISSNVLVSARGGREEFCYLAERALCSQTEYSFSDLET